MEAMQTEVNPSKSYETSTRIILRSLSRFHNDTPFPRMKRDLIVMYLDSVRKSEERDPLHKWIGTYNRYLSILARFFRWLNNPNLEPYM
jgi:hypothetical protein